MTWSRVAVSPVSVGAWKTKDAKGKVLISLTVGSQSVMLSEDDAASLGGYLLGVTQNEAPKPGEEI